MPANKRSFILAACSLLILLCAAFPPREFSPDTSYLGRPSRKFLFFSSLYSEDFGGGGIARVHVDAGRLAAETLVILSLTGIVLLATNSRA